MCCPYQDGHMPLRKQTKESHFKFYIEDERVQAVGVAYERQSGTNFPDCDLCKYRGLQETIPW